MMAAQSSSPPKNPTLAGIVNRRRPIPTDQTVSTTAWSPKAKPFATLRETPIVMKGS
jgi:hypothetical protein